MERRATRTRSLLQNIPFCRLQPAAILNLNITSPSNRTTRYPLPANLTSILPTHVSIRHSSMFSPIGESIRLPPGRIHTPRHLYLYMIMGCVNVTSTPALGHTTIPHESLSSLIQYLGGYVEIESALLIAQDESSTQRSGHVNMPTITPWQLATNTSRI